MFDKFFGNIFIWSFLCIKYWFEINFHSIQGFNIETVTTWFMFLVTLGKGFIWIWLTRVYRNSETFKISIYCERYWKFFEMILKFENTVFGRHFYSHCFILATIRYVFFKEIFFSKMSKTLFTNVYFT